jgi:histidyl-tRNA synthetase
MSNNLPQNLKGFRDFLGPEAEIRDFVKAKLAETFRVYGFQPLETPTLEYAELLLGKYGTEADKLLYKFNDRGEREVALRYDQTVPTARVISHYQNELPRFYRRYQLQNVFRADKPQKGRYREFMQCDIDIFNTKSHLADAEILACFYDALSGLGFNDLEIMVNDRTALVESLTPFATEQVDVFSIIQSVDKLDKQTVSEVAAELEAKGLVPERATAALAALDALQPTANLEKIIDAAQKLGVPVAALKFNPALARGLDYYTGMIFEIRSQSYKNGSLAGGGRYDNLISQLGGPDIPAVGGSIGFDRAVDACKDLGLLSASEKPETYLACIYDEETTPAVLELAAKLRAEGKRVEVYPEPAKLGKQLSYADKNGFTHALIIGPEELGKREYVVKDLVAASEERRAL